MIAPLKLIGYWSVCLDDPEWVHPTTLPPAGRTPLERDILVTHLRNGAFVFAELGMAHNRFPGPPFDLGSSELTDGAWLWPEGLWWYVWNRDVPLPREFEEHVRANPLTRPAREVAFDSIEAPIDLELWTAWCRALRRDAPEHGGWLARVCRALARVGRRR